MNDIEKRKSKKFFFISALIFILVCAGMLMISIYAIQPKYKQHYNQMLKECLQENNDKYYIMMIQKTGDAQYCSKINRPEMTGLCNGIRTEGLYCTIGSEEEIKSCLAQLEKNPALCPEEDYWCMALASGDTSYCAQIQGNEFRKECITYAARDAGALISEEAKKDCEDKAYFYAAEMTGNKELCSKISRIELRNACLG